MIIFKKKMKICFSENSLSYFSSTKLILLMKPAESKNV